MTTTENLLVRKEKLLRQQSGCSDTERDEIERQIAQIDTALYLLEPLDVRADRKEP